MPLSGVKERRLGGGAEDEGVEDLFLKEDFVGLLAAAMALAICFRSPVNCWKGKEKKGKYNKKYIRFERNRSMERA